MDIRNILAKLDTLNEGTMAAAKKHSRGPKFPGYWKGTDPASKSKSKMVGAAESVLKDLEKELVEGSVKRNLEEEFAAFKEEPDNPRIDLTPNYPNYATLVGEFVGMKGTRARFKIIDAAVKSGQGETEKIAMAVASGKPILVDFSRIKNRAVLENDEDPFAPSQRAATSIATRGWRRGGERTGSYQGSITTTFDHIKSAIGDPIDGPTNDPYDKVSCEWILTFKDGVVASIYDYKTGGTPMGEYAWHIGGNNKKAVEYVSHLLGIKPEVNEGSDDMFADRQSQKIGQAIIKAGKGAIADAPISWEGDEDMIEFTINDGKDMIKIGKTYLEKGIAAGNAAFWEVDTAVRDQMYDAVLDVGIDMNDILDDLDEGVDIGQEWMSDTELDQYIPANLQQQWSELLGYDRNGNPSALWANLTGGYEPDVNDPEHRALMVKVANKWFAAKKIPNVKFYNVKDADDELEWLVQIGPQSVSEEMTPPGEFLNKQERLKAGDKVYYKGRVVGIATGDMDDDRVVFKPVPGYGTNPNFASLPIDLIGLREQHEFTDLELAIMEGGHSLDEARIHHPGRINVYFKPDQHGEHSRVVAENIPSSTLDALIGAMVKKFGVSPSDFSWQSVDDPFGQRLNEYGMTTGGMAGMNATAPADPAADKAATAQQLSNVQANANKLKAAGVNLPAGTGAVAQSAITTSKNPNANAVTGQGMDATGKKITGALGQEMEKLLTTGNPAQVQQVANAIKQAKMGQK